MDRKRGDGIPRCVLVDMIAHELSERGIRPEDYNDRAPWFGTAEGIVQLAEARKIVHADKHGLFPPDAMNRMPIDEGSAIMPPSDEALLEEALLALATRAAREHKSETGQPIPIKLLHPILSDRFGNGTRRTRAVYAQLPQELRGHSRTRKP